MFRKKKVGSMQKLSVPYQGNEHIRSSGITDLQPLEYYFDDGKTLHEIFMRGVRISGDKPCFIWKHERIFPYAWISYNEVLNRAKSIGSGLIFFGAKPNPLQLIGILAHNCVEWLLVQQACNCYSMVTVPFSDPVSDETFKYIVDVCDLKILVVDTSKRAQRILTLIMNMLISLDLLVVIESVQEEIIRLGNDYRVKVIQLSQLEQAGKKCNQDIVAPKPNDLHTITFLNCATGVPKGVKLTHRNFAVSISNIYAFGDAIDANFKSSDMYMSYAPLSFTVETLMGAALFAIGAKLGLHFGKDQNILSDIQDLRPTLLPCPSHLVKYIFELVVAESTKSALKQYLFQKALQAKLKLLKQGIITKTSFWDRVVFRRVRKMFGGKIRICITGGSFATVDSFNFLKCALGTKIIAGYGLSETTNLITYSHPQDVCPESVGPPVPSLLVKLIDVADQNYFVESGFGEICVMGGNVFSGYYKDEALTNLVIDDEGWFHTGDIGTWIENGSLKIVDKKKSFFALSSGKRIVPEKIESLLEEVPVISQIFVYGNSRHDAIVAIVIPARDIFQDWCLKKFIFGDYQTLIENSAVSKLIFDNLASYGKMKGLQPWEIPKSIFIHPESFTKQNGLLNEDEKILRINAYEKFKNEIESMLQ